MGDGNGSGSDGSDGNGAADESGAVAAVTSPSDDAFVPPDQLGVDGHSPSKVLELAAACVRFVTTSLKCEPDFTRETLGMVDQYVRDAREAVRERPETLAVSAHAVGAYLGEVVRRLHDCWWRLDKADPGAWRLEFRDVFLTYYPVQIAYTVLTLDEEGEAFSGFEMRDTDRDSVVARLSELPAVSEDEYYAPSTRLEVLDIAIEQLVSLQIADPREKREYEPSDYE